MIPGTEQLITVAMDTMAILILFGIAVIPESRDEKHNTGSRLFTFMGLFILIGVVSELIFRLFPDAYYGGGMYAAKISGIVMELSIVDLLILFFIYTDFELYESRDHLKRHMALFVAPVLLFAAVCLLTPLWKKLFSLEGSLLTDIYLYTQYLELVILVLSAVHFIIYYKKFGKKRFFHPLSIYVPVLCGALFTFFLRKPVW